ncbi:uncharacterized protein LOC144179627 [Haemaphysalis longicornis]
MTFLGTRIRTKADIPAFLESLPTVANIDTIVFQTHMVPETPPPSTCETRLLTIRKETGNVLALEIAESAATQLKSRGHLGRLTRALFSLTLGVVVYSGRSGAPAFKGPNEACTSAQNLGLSKLCDASVRNAPLQYSAEDTAEYAAFVENNVPYFVIHETQRSLKDKVDSYVKTGLSKGWAIFDADRDENTKCQEPASWQRLSFLNSTLISPTSTNR